MLFFVACNCTECISWRTAYLPYHLTTTTANAIENENDTKDEKIQALMKKIHSKKNWTALRIRLGSNNKKIEEPEKQQQQSSTNNICLDIRNSNPYVYRHVYALALQKLSFTFFLMYKDLRLFFLSSFFALPKICTPISSSNILTL